jgi:predicted MFS family arabinose efflux permease
MRPAVITLLGVGVLLLASFVVVERRSAHPMIDLGLFRRPSFAAVTTAAFAIGGGIIALLSFISGFTGRALDMAPTTTAWLMLAWSGPSVLTAIAARRLPNRWTGRARMATTLGVIAVGQLMLWGIDSTSGAGRFLPGLLLAGVATGVLNAALGRESVASVPEGQSALGSGANNTARYLGSALGVTVVSVVATPSGAPTTAALLAGWNHAVIVTAVVSLLGALIVLLVGERPAIASRHEVPSAQDDGTLENAGTS